MLRALALSPVLTGALVAPVQAQALPDRASLGGHFGVDLTHGVDEQRIGIQASLSLGDVVEVQPLLSLFLTSKFPPGAFTAMATVRFRASPSSHGRGRGPYAGAGIKYSHVGTPEWLDVGVAGLQISGRRFRPFIESHVFGVLKRRTVSVNVVAGLNVALRSGPAAGSVLRPESGRHGSP